MNQFARRREGDPVSEDQALISDARVANRAARQDSEAKVVTDALAKGATQAGDQRNANE